MHRRSFLRNATFGAIAGTALVVPAACGPSRYVQGRQEGSKLMVPHTVWAVQKRGETIQRPMVMLRAEGVPFPIVLYRLAEEDFAALLMVCTHKGCTLQAYASQLVCPCHGSEFNNTGQVLEGPAIEPLRRYVVSTEPEHAIIHLDKTL